MASETVWPVIDLTNWTSWGSGPGMSGFVYTTPNLKMEFEWGEAAEHIIPLTMTNYTGKLGEKGELTFILYIDREAENPILGVAKIGVTVQ